MMFEVGERVVCVEGWRSSYADFECVKGCIYTVRSVVLKGDTPDGFDRPSPYDGIQVEEIFCASGGIYPCWHWPAFRKLRNLDTSQSLQALIDLPNKVKNGEFVS